MISHFAGEVVSEKPNKHYVDADKEHQADGLPSMLAHALARSPNDICLNSSGSDL